MESEEGRENDTEASQLSRREYLLATGVLTGGAVTAVSGSASATADVTVDASVPSVNHNWQTVELTDTYADPVVVAPTLSHYGTNPASPRVRNVTEDSFDLTVQEWRYLDGRHLSENIGCFVTDAGEHQPTDGPTFETGRVETNHHWASVSFSSSFSSTPVVFSSVQTYTGPDPVVTRHRNVSASGFEVRLQEEESGGAHYPETVGYLAMEPGTGTIDGMPCEAGLVDGVSDNWQTLSFSGSYRRPIFLADMQATLGTNTASIRYRNLDESSVEVKIEEERSLDRETAHLPEPVGYVVLEGEPTIENGFGQGGYGDGGYGQ